MAYVYMGTLWVASRRERLPPLKVGYGVAAGAAQQQQQQQQLDASAECDVVPDVLSCAELGIRVVQPDAKHLHIYVNAAPAQLPPRTQEVATASVHTLLTALEEWYVEAGGPFLECIATAVRHPEPSSTPPRLVATALVPRVTPYAAPCAYRWYIRCSELTTQVPATIDAAPPPAPPPPSRRQPGVAGQREAWTYEEARWLDALIAHSPTASWQSAEHAAAARASDSSRGGGCVVWMYESPTQRHSFHSSSGLAAPWGLLEVWQACGTRPLSPFLLRLVAWMTKAPPDTLEWAYATPSCLQPDSMQMASGATHLEKLTASEAGLDSLIVEHLEDLCAADDTLPTPRPPPEPRVAIHRTLELYLSAALRIVDTPCASMKGRRGVARLVARLASTAVWQCYVMGRRAPSVRAPPLGVLGTSPPWPHQPQDSDQDEPIVWSFASLVGIQACTGARSRRLLSSGLVAGLLAATASAAAPGRRVQTACVSGAWLAVPHAHLILCAPGRQASWARAISDAVGAIAHDVAADSHLTMLLPCRATANLDAGTLWADADAHAHDDDGGASAPCIVVMDWETWGAALSATLMAMDAVEEAESDCTTEIDEAADAASEVDAPSAPLAGRHVLWWRTPLLTAGVPETFSSRALQGDFATQFYTRFRSSVPAFALFAWGSILVDAPPPSDLHAASLRFLRATTSVTWVHRTPCPLPLSVAPELLRTLQVATPMLALEGAHVEVRRCVWPLLRGTGATAWPLPRPPPPPPPPHPSAEDAAEAKNAAAAPAPTGTRARFDVVLRPSTISTENSSSSSGNSMPWREVNRYAHAQASSHHESSGDSVASRLGTVVGRLLDVMRCSTSFPGMLPLAQLEGVRAWMLAFPSLVVSLSAAHSVTPEHAALLLDTPAVCGRTARELTHAREQVATLQRAVASFAAATVAATSETPPAAPRLPCSDVECAVCLSTVDTPTWTVTRCGHAACADCAAGMAWNKCPVCLVPLQAVDVLRIGMAPQARSHVDASALGKWYHLAAELRRLNPATTLVLVPDAGMPQAWLQHLEALQQHRRRPSTATDALGVDLRAWTTRMVSSANAYAVARDACSATWTFPVSSPLAGSTRTTFPGRRWWPRAPTDDEEAAAAAAATASTLACGMAWHDVETLVVVHPPASVRSLWEYTTVFHAVCDARWRAARTRFQWQGMTAASEEEASGQRGLDVAPLLTVRQLVGIAQEYELQQYNAWTAYIAQCERALGDLAHYADVRADSEALRWERSLFQSISSSAVAALAPTTEEKDEGSSMVPRVSPSEEAPTAAAADDTTFTPPPSRRRRPSPPTAEDSSSSPSDPHAFVASPPAPRRRAAPARYVDLAAARSPTPTPTTTRRSSPRGGGAVTVVRRSSTGTAAAPRVRRLAPPPPPPSAA